MWEYGIPQVFAQSPFKQLQQLLSATGSPTTQMPQTGAAAQQIVCQCMWKSTQNSFESSTEISIHIIEIKKEIQTSHPNSKSVSGLANFESKLDFLFKKT